VGPGVHGGRTRLEDLHVSVAACLTAQALNIGYAPVPKRGAPALEPDRQVGARIARLPVG
jgi:hypothetical protein